MTTAFERYAIPALIGFAPVVLLLLTWTYDAPTALNVQIMRGYALPIVVVEIFVIVVAVRQGLVGAIRQWWRPRHIWLPLAALIAIAILTAAFAAPNPTIAFTRTFLLLVHLLFGASIALLCGRAFDRSLLVNAIMAGFLIFVVLLSVFVLLIPDPATFNWVNGFAAMSHIRHFGYYTAAIAALALGVLAVPPTRSAFMLAFLTSALAIALAFWTGTRGAVAAVFIGWVVSLALFPAMRLLRSSAASSLSVLVGTLIAFLLPSPHAHMGFNRTVTAMAGQGDAGFTSLRTDLWWQTFEAIRQRPWFGYGEGQAYLVTTWSNIGHPHNAFLQFLVAWGGVGTALLLVLAIPFAYRATLETRAAQDRHLPAYMLMMVLIGYAMIDGTLYHVLPLSLLAVAMGLLAAGRTQGQESG